MATFIRKNAWDQNGTFNNPDLFWYAKGVQGMQSRAFEDPTSWWFFAAMHGQFLVDAPMRYPNWTLLPGPPAIKTAPIPSDALRNMYWDQCQHGTWFFPPWHRGYLYALENILRKIIIEAGGPADWALPYWNYFGPGDQFKMPPAFANPTLQNGSQNPLYVNARYGPKPTADRNIYVDRSVANQKCQSVPYYTGEGTDYYGGDTSGFAHSDGAAGALEYNPHNAVHGMIGGKIFPNHRGLMSDPDTAALDPIFYLHHCNIDRMWAAWTAAGRANPIEPDWLNGPDATADRTFYMPKTDGTPWPFNPQMVNHIDQLDYTYEDLSLGTALPQEDKNLRRMRNLAVTLDDLELFKDMEPKTESELVGSNNKPITLDGSGARTTVRLDSNVWQTVADSLETMTLKNRLDEGKLPDEVYLKLEGIKGNADANTYSVTVNDHFVGHLFLFGLRKASIKDDKHAGQGLNIVFNITSVVDKLHLANSLALESLDVLIQPKDPSFEDEKCSIDRISVYRKGSK